MATKQVQRLLYCNETDVDFVFGFDDLLFLFLFGGIGVGSSYGYLRVPHDTGLAKGSTMPR